MPKPDAVLSVPSLVLFLVVVPLSSQRLLLADGGPAPPNEAPRAPPAGDVNRAECHAWLEETFRADALSRELSLDLADEIATTRECTDRDLRRMKPRIPVGWCSNVFQIHCSGLDLLTSIGEALADRCESATADLAPSPESVLCLRDRVFEDYAESGVATDVPGCRRLLEACEGPEGGPNEPSASWPGWGGPRGDFRVPDPGLAASWGDAGPRVLWRRPLGDGYSGLVAAGGRLYTMAREDDREVTVALDAGDGTIVWESSSVPPPFEGFTSYGVGPRATPLWHEGLLVTVGATGSLRVLDAADGTLRWSRELSEPPIGGRWLGHGFSSSPAAWRDTVLIMAAGAQAGVVAFDPDDGSILWQTRGFLPTYASPRVVELGGAPQLLVFAGDELAAFDPTDGRSLWSVPHENTWKQNISPPVELDDSTLLISSPQAGARALRLRLEGDEWRPEILWRQRRFQVYHASAVRQGDLVVGSIGVTSPAFLAAIDVRDGEVVWKERGFAKANCMSVGERTLVLDEDGRLALVRPDRTGLRVEASSRILEDVAWTPPTLVGTTLFARDRSEVVALDLG